MPPAPRPELSTLCESCGMCCDGSLFGRVDLETAEVDHARKHRLSVLPSGKAFEQPCAALTASGHGRRCSVYADRPRSCRRFVCRLYERHQRDGGPIEDRIAIVRRVRSLVASLEASGATAADFEAVLSSGRSADGPVADAMPAYTELARILERDFSPVR